MIIIIMIIIRYNNNNFKGIPWAIIDPQIVGTTRGSALPRDHCNYQSSQLNAGITQHKHYTAAVCKHKGQAP